MTLQTIKTSVLKFVNDEEGLTAVEYAVAGGLVSLGVVLAFTNLGVAISTTINLLIAAM